jgi:hypothetical protein
MKVSTMDLSPYTHIHLAFGHVTTSWAIDVSHIQVQWELFKDLSDVKKILSLGGWSFSAEAPTYSIFRDAVLPANQDTFVANIISFVLLHELDGIDIDWECKLAMFCSYPHITNPNNRSRCSGYPRHSTRYVSLGHCHLDYKCIYSYFGKLADLKTPQELLQMLPIISPFSRS